jgi:hypothetical protein
VAKRVNYGQEKRQRELAKQKKKQRKEQQKADRRRSGESDVEAPTGSVRRPTSSRGPDRG